MNDWPTLQWHVNVDDLLVNHQVKEVIACGSGTPESGIFHHHRGPAVARVAAWAGQPTLVMDQFCAGDFNLVVDDRADVHVNSKDGSFYLGWFPSGPPGTDSEGWKIAVTGTAKVRGYQMSFDTETPADIVAAAVARVLETSSRCDSRGSSRSPSGGPAAASPGRHVETKTGHLPPEAVTQPARHS